MFILASHRDLSKVESYMYADIAIVSRDSADAFVPKQFAIFWARDMDRAEQFQGRLQSGLYGARIFETLEEAQAEIDSWK